MILPLPILQAELVRINNAVRYRVHYDQCEAWHFHVPEDGHQECHCVNPDSLYHRTGYFVELEERSTPVLQTHKQQVPATGLILAAVAVAAMVGAVDAEERLRDPKSSSCEKEYSERPFQPIFVSDQANC